MMDEPEKLYLVCQSCGEVFDSITIAYDHMTRLCEAEGFEIKTEREAF